MPLAEEKEATDEASSVGEVREPNQIDHLKDQLAEAKKIRLKKKSKAEMREEIQESYRSSAQKIAEQVEILRTNMSVGEIRAKSIQPVVLSNNAALLAAPSLHNTASRASYETNLLPQITHNYSSQNLKIQK